MDFFFNKNILKHFFFSWKQIPFFFFPVYMQLSATAQRIKYSAFKKQMFRVEILRLNPKLIKRHPELTWGYPCSHLVPTLEGLPRIREIFFQNLWTWVDHERLFLEEVRARCFLKLCFKRFAHQKPIVKSSSIKRAQGARKIRLFSLEIKHRSGKMPNFPPQKTRHFVVSTT